MPASPHEWLCESCGYALAGLSLQDRCPECGRPAELSDPARRPGSPWQQHVGLGAIARTALGVLASPQGYWDRVIVDRGTGRSLTWVHAGLTSILAIGVPGYVAKAWAPMVVFLPATVALVFLLTTVESLGLRFWGRAHGSRVNKDVAWAVCGHASAGWTLGAVVSVIAWLAAGLLGFGPRVASIQMGPWMAVSGVTLAGALLVGAVTGLMTFEILAYLGVRRMRFANHAAASVGVSAEAAASAASSSSSSAGAGMSSELSR